MPNRCTNIVTIKGKITHEVTDKLLDKKGEVSFEMLLPMPEDLVGSRSPAIILEAWVDKLEYAKNYWKKVKDEELKEKRIEETMREVLTESESEELKKKYWANNRYDWSMKNRGTKWDASHIDVKQAIEGDEITLIFDTARWPPDEWYKALIKVLPNHEVYMEFEEGGMGFQWHMKRWPDWEAVYHEEDYVGVCEYCEEKPWVYHWDIAEWICPECLSKALEEEDLFQCEYCKELFTSHEMLNERNKCESCQGLK